MRVLYLSFPFLLGSLFFFHCKSSYLEGDPYQDTLDCEGLDPMMDGNDPRFLSCVNALQQVVSIDDTFQNFDKSRYGSLYGSQTERVIRALIFLRNQPAFLNIDKAIWGIAPPRQSLPQDLLQLLDDYPDRKPNQILFHYVIQSVKKFKLETNLLKTELVAASYNQIQRSLILSVATLKNSTPEFFTRVFKDAMILLHEARHSAGSHQVICLELLADSIACDMDMDGPHGWEFAYTWALLQSNEQKAWKPYQAVYMAEYLFRKLQFIQSLYESARPLREMADKYRVKSKESFLNSYVIPYQELLVKEQLTSFGFTRQSTLVRFSKDYYTEAIVVCPLKQPFMSDSCRDLLEDFIGFKAGYPLSFISKSMQTFLRNNLFILLITSVSFPLEKKIMGVIPAQNLIASDLQFLKEFYKTMSWNQLLFNYIIESFRRSPEQYHLLLSDSRNFPQSVTTSFDAIAWFIKNARMLSSEFHQSCETFQNTPECLQTNQELGFEMSFRWALLKTSWQASKTGNPLLSSAEILYFAKSFCVWLETNRAYMALHQLDQIWSKIPPISCTHDVLQQLVEE